MLKNSLLLIFLGLTSISFSQERYKVLYDYQTEKIQFFSLDENNEITDTLKKPRFKKNSAIEIQLQNLNPFAVNVEADLSEEEIHRSSGNSFNFGSLLGGINSMSQDNLNLNVGNLPVSDTIFSRGAKNRGQSLNAKFNDLNDISTNVNAIKNTLLSNLKNPNLSKQQIQDNILNLSSKIQDVRLPNPNENYYNFLANLEKLAVQSKNEIASDINVLKADVEVSSSNSEMSRGELVMRNNSYSQLEALLHSVSNATNNSVKDISQIKTMYAALESSSFSKVYDYNLDSDKSNIELTFRESDFGDSEADGTNVIKKRNIRIFSKGSFKINTGVALTMNNFENTSNDFYINQEGEIGSSVNDNFIPNLSTMINFYPIISENFNIGGSFGLSVPISDDVNGVNFLLGPSVFLGNESRFSISGGLAYGPVDKLTNGYEPGMAVELNSLDGFTKTVYDVGYYFGVSFSIFNIN